MNEEGIIENNTPIAYNYFIDNARVFKDCSYCNAVLLRGFDQNTTCERMFDNILRAILFNEDNKVYGIMVVTEADNPSDDLSVVVLIQNLRKLLWNLRIFYEGFNNEFSLEEQELDCRT